MVAGTIHGLMINVAMRSKLTIPAVHHFTVGSATLFVSAGAATSGLALMVVTVALLRWRCSASGPPLVYRQIYLPVEDLSLLSIHAADTLLMLLRVCRSEPILASLLILILSVAILRCGAIGVSSRSC